jgi:hypothetical protein
VSATLQVLINGSKSELEELMINEIVVRVPAIVVLAILWAIALCARPISAHGRIRSRRRGCGQSRAIYATSEQLRQYRLSGLECPTLTYAKRPTGYERSAQANMRPISAERVLFPHDKR